jgi:hypothetical protein
LVVDHRVPVANDGKDNSHDNEEQMMMMEIFN